MDRFAVDPLADVAPVGARALVQRATLSRVCCSTALLSRCLLFMGLVGPDWSLSRIHVQLRLIWETAVEVDAHGRRYVPQVHAGDCDVVERRAYLHSGMS